MRKRMGWNSPFRSVPGFSNHLTVGLPVQWILTCVCVRLGVSCVMTLVYIHVCTACSLASVCPECSPGSVCLAWQAYVTSPSLIALCLLFNRDRLVELSFPGTFCCSV